MPDNPVNDPQTHALIGAGMEVHREMGHGFSETVYQESLAKEFKKRGIPFVREARLPISYKGEQLETVFKADFLCFDDVVVETKALAKLATSKLRR